MAWSKLVQRKASLPIWNWIFFKVLSHPKHSVILWCEKEARGWDTRDHHTQLYPENAVIKVASIHTSCCWKTCTFICLNDLLFFRSCCYHSSRATEEEDASLLFSRSNFELTISYANFSCKLWIATGHKKKPLKIYKTNNSLWTSTWESLSYQYKSTLSKHYPDLKHQAWYKTAHHTLVASSFGLLSVFLTCHLWLVFQKLLFMIKGDFLVYFC